MSKVIQFIPRLNSLLDSHWMVDLSLPLYAILWCTCFLACCLFARKFNMVPNIVPTFDEWKHLCRRDIILDVNQVVIYIKCSLFIYMVLLFAARVAVLNIFSLLTAPLRWSNLLFPIQEWVSDSDSSVLLVLNLRVLLRATGHNQTGCAKHSWHRMNFTLASEVLGELIMTEGDGRSQSYIRYLGSSGQ